MFTIVTTQGRKTVSVSGLPLDHALSGEQNPEIMEILRSIWKQAASHMSPQSSQFQPDGVTIITERLPDDASTAGDWPPEFVGHLVGDSARVAADLADVGPYHRLRIDGQAHGLTIKPVLPLLHVSHKAGVARGAPPLHPDATAYDLPGLPIRVPGASQEEVAAFFWEQMSVAGWKAVGPTEPNLQIWSRNEEPNDPIIELHFWPDHYKVGTVRTNGGFPTYLDSGAVPCVIASCDQTNQPQTIDEVKAWWARYAGYAGWTTVGEDEYARGVDLVRLKFYVDGDDVAAIQLRSENPATPPPSPDAPPLRGALPPPGAPPPPLVTPAPPPETIRPPVSVGIDDSGRSIPHAGRIVMEPDLAVVGDGGDVYRIRGACPEVEELLHASVGKYAVFALTLDSLGSAASGGPLTALSVNAGGGAEATCERDNGDPLTTPAPPPDRQ
jgi:hypothetical protein